MLIGLLFGAISFVVLIAKEKNFEVSTDYLIVQNQNQSGPVDPYSLAKFADYNGQLFEQAIYSEVFIDQVVKTGKVNPEFLPFDTEQKLKTWANMVDVKENSTVGILSVAIFDNNSQEGNNVAAAVAQVLTQENYLFRGDGQNIDIRVLTGPVETKNPSFADICAAAGGGFIFSILVASLWIVWKEDQRRRKIYGFSIIHPNPNQSEKQG